MLLPVLVAFQLAAGRPAVFDALKGQTEARAPRIDTTITIDGRLDKPVWRRAAILTGFSEYAPVDQRPAPDSTEVLVWYSPTALYFGIRAYEPHGIVRATLADRDKITNDDNVELHLDTFREGRKTVVFIVNPLGVQADGTKNEGGGFMPGSNVAGGGCRSTATHSTTVTKRRGLRRSRRRPASSRRKANCAVSPASRTARCSRSIPNSRTRSLEIHRRRELRGAMHPRRSSAAT